VMTACDISRESAWHQGDRIANAIYHATGKRIRDLPITLDKLMA